MLPFLKRSIMSLAASRPVIAVISPLDNSALMPMSSSLFKDLSVSFIVGNDISTLNESGQLKDAVGVVWLPPGKPTVLRDLVRNGHVPSLRRFHSFYSGVDAIVDIMREDLHPLGISFSNGRGAFSSSLAEYAMTAALHFVKQIPRIQSNRQVKRWDKFVMPELRGRTLGLLGYGDVGKTTAKLAKAFGMRVIALRRNADKYDSTELLDEVIGPRNRNPILPSHKAALLSQSDVVVCTLPGTHETTNFMSNEEFNVMKDDAVFISLGRGSVVDEAALAESLRRGHLAGAALDVFATEPLAETSTLWDCCGDRIILTAHNADFTTDYFVKGWKIWRDNYNCFLNGERPATPVDPHIGY